MSQLPTNPILVALAGSASCSANRRIAKGLTVAAAPDTRPTDSLYKHPPDFWLDTRPVIATPQNHEALGKDDGCGMPTPRGTS